MSPKSVAVPVRKTLNQNGPLGGAVHAAFVSLLIVWALRGSIITIKWTNKKDLACMQRGNMLVSLCVEDVECFHVCICGVLHDERMLCFASIPENSCN